MEPSLKWKSFFKHLDFRKSSSY